ncbi:MAG: hypothetical protein ACP5I6_01285 [Caldisphaera sp.]|jgi:predicted thioredoxin/glutaredoxin|nr:hypothetical protein [Caldisphaera sp.]PMP60888.1 MAG: hypothetical protein C0201_01500 [Caldisphaera sp.]PMP89273.1 MAG: hypothetical protein C0172_00525 [Caldisphaera sp.]
MGNLIEIYIHPTCATSYEVITGLYNKGYLDKVKIKNTEKIIGNKFVLSVPWIEFNGVPIATDPVTVDDVIEIIENNKINVENPTDSVMMSIVHSSFLSSIVMLHKDIEVALNELFLNAALRVPLSKINVEDVKNEMVKWKNKLFDEYRDMIRRALSVSYVRELYWTYSQIKPEEISSITNKNIVGLWIIAKGSIGRVALPARPYLDNDKDIELISEFVKKRSKGLLEKVKEEQEKIRSNELYWKIIEKI